VKRAIFLWLRPVVVLAALALNACSGVQGERNLRRHDPAIQAVQALPGASSDRSQSETTHEVKGVVTAIDTNSITVDGVVYYNIANLSELAGMLQVGDTVKLEFTTNPNGSLSIRAEIASADVEGTPHPSETPEADETPEASETPHPQDDNEVLGVVTAIDATTITVDGVVYNLADFTEIEGTIQVGDTVKLEFITNPDGTLSVRAVKVADHSQDDRDNQGSDDSHNDSHDDSHDANDNHDADHSHDDSHDSNDSHNDDHSGED